MYKKAREKESQSRSAPEGRRSSSSSSSKGFPSRMTTRKATPAKQHCTHHYSYRVSLHTPPRVFSFSYVCVCIGEGRKCPPRGDGGFSPSGVLRTSISRWRRCDARLGKERRFSRNIGSFFSLFQSEYFCLVYSKVIMSCLGVYTDWCDQRLALRG